MNEVRVFVNEPELTQAHFNYIIERLGLDMDLVSLSVINEADNMAFANVEYHPDESKECKIARVFVNGEEVGVDEVSKKIKPIEVSKVGADIDETPYNKDEYAFVDWDYECPKHRWVSISNSCPEMVVRKGYAQDSRVWRCEYEVKVKNPKKCFEKTKTFTILFYSDGNSRTIIDLPGIFKINSDGNTVSMSKRVVNLREEAFWGKGHPWSFETLTLSGSTSYEAKGMHIFTISFLDETKESFYVYLDGMLIIDHSTPWSKKKYRYSMELSNNDTVFHRKTMWIEFRDETLDEKAYKRIFLSKYLSKMLEKLVYNKAELLNKNTGFFKWETANSNVPKYHKNGSPLFGKNRWLSYSIPTGVFDYEYEPGRIVYGWGFAPNWMLFNMRYGKDRKSSIFKAFYHPYRNTEITNYFVKKDGKVGFANTDKSNLEFFCSEKYSDLKDVRLPQTFYMNNLCDFYSNGNKSSGDSSVPGRGTIYLGKGVVSSFYDGEITNFVMLRKAPIIDKNIISKTLLPDYFFEGELKLVVDKKADYVFYFGRKVFSYPKKEAKWLGFSKNINGYGFFAGSNAVKIFDVDEVKEIQNNDFTIIVDFMPHKEYSYKRILTFGNIALELNKNTLSLISSGDVLSYEKEIELFRAYKVVVVKKGNFLYMYVNNETAGATFYNKSNTITPASIGAQLDEKGNLIKSLGFFGTVSSLKVYKRALEESEIEDEFNHSYYSVCHFEMPLRNDYSYKSINVCPVKTKNVSFKRNAAYIENGFIEVYLDTLAYASQLFNVEFEAMLSTNVDTSPLVELDKIKITPVNNTGSIFITTPDGLTHQVNIREVNFSNKFYKYGFGYNSTTKEFYVKVNDEKILSYSIDDVTISDVTLRFSPNGFIRDLKVYDFETPNNRIIDYKYIDAQTISFADNGIVKKGNSSTFSNNNLVLNTVEKNKNEAIMFIEPNPNTMERDLKIYIFSFGKVHKIVNDDVDLVKDDYVEITTDKGKIYFEVPTYRTRVVKNETPYKATIIRINKYDHGLEEAKDTSAYRATSYLIILKKVTGNVTVRAHLGPDGTYVKRKYRAIGIDKAIEHTNYKQFNSTITERLVGLRIFHPYTHLIRIDGKPFALLRKGTITDLSTNPRERLKQIRSVFKVVDARYEHIEYLLNNAYRDDKCTNFGIEVLAKGINDGEISKSAHFRIRGFMYGGCEVDNEKDASIYVGVRGDLLKVWKTKCSECVNEDGEIDNDNIANVLWSKTIDTLENVEIETL